MARFIQLSECGRRIYIDADSIESVEEQEEEDDLFTVVSLHNGTVLTVDNTTASVVQLIEESKL